MLYQSELIKDYYKSGEVADMIGVHTRTIHNYCKKGILDEVMTDTHRRLIPRDSLIKYLDSKGMIYKNELFDALYYYVEDIEIAVKKHKESGFEVSNHIRFYEDVEDELEVQRNGLKNLLSDIINKRIKRVFILHKDMLSAIGFDYFKMICDITHTEIVILEVSNNKCNNRNLIK